MPYLRQDSRAELYILFDHDPACAAVLLQDSNELQESQTR